MYVYDALNMATGGMLARVVATGNCIHPRDGYRSHQEDSGCLDAPEFSPAGSTVNHKDTDCICPLWAHRE